MCDALRPTRHEQGVLQVYDLGADGRDMRKVAEVTNFAQAAERAAGGRDIFGGRSSADRKVKALTLCSPSRYDCHRRFANTDEDQGMSTA